MELQNQLGVLMASKSLLLICLLKKKNQIFILSMEGEPIQLTKDKYGASNLNGPQMAKKYCFHPAYHAIYCKTLY
jgi:hypothetical protein